MMLRKLLLICLYLLSTPLFAQSKLTEEEIGYFKKSEQQLLILSKLILNGKDEASRVEANKSFKELLELTLNMDNSYSYSFDSLPTISILTSPDKKVRIFNWELKHSANNYEYFGFIQYHIKENNNTLLYTLNDNSADIKRPELAALTNDNWYGAHYYKLVEIKQKKKTYYYLLALDWNNSLSRKKIIEVLYFSKEGYPKFGDNVFKVKNQTYRRYIMEYAAEITASLKFNEKENAFIMDNLAPKSPELKGQFQFYGPDMTYNAFVVKKGRLNWVEDYDARNAKNAGDKLYNDPTKNTVNPGELNKK